MAQLEWIFKEAKAPLLPERAVKIFLVTMTLYASMLVGVYISPLISNTKLPNEEKSSPLISTFISYHIL